MRVLYFSSRTTPHASSAARSLADAELERLWPAPAFAGNDTLLLEIGNQGENDTDRLDQIAAYASWIHESDANRSTHAIALLGAAHALPSPRHAIWLRPDGTWSSWPDLSFAREALEALAEKSAQRRGARDDAARYWTLCRDLRVGACAATLDGKAFLEADAEVARMLGYESEAREALLTKGPVDFLPQPSEWKQFVAALQARPDHHASSTLEVSRQNGERANVRIVGGIYPSPSGQDIVAGFLHDFTGLADDEHLVRLRMAALLDDLGFAYFSTKLDGTPELISRKDRELLGYPPDEVYGGSRAQWWVSPEARAKWLGDLQEKRVVTEHPVLLRTHKGRHVWVEAHSRLVRDASGKPVSVEGIYHDATRRQVAERLSLALSVIAASDVGNQRTAEIICEEAIRVFDGMACALMLRDEEHGYVFPAHLLLEDGPWSAREKSDNREASRPPRAFLFEESEGSWLSKLTHEGAHIASSGEVGSVLDVLWGQAMTSCKEIVILPLLRPTVNVEEDTEYNQCPIGYLWIPLTSPPAFSPADFRSQLEMFARLCSQQLRAAADRDAFGLIRSLLQQRKGMLGLKELDEILGEARKSLQHIVPMEGCSVLRIGVEDQRHFLWLVATSGLERHSRAGAFQAYEMGEGLTGGAAASRKSYLSVDAAHERGFQGKYREATVHPLGSWLGVPVLDSKGSPVGIIRCANRSIGRHSRLVTGFSIFDVQTVEAFAQAVGLITELALMYEERSRILKRITHEIRTPIVGLRYNIEYLQDHYPPPDAKFATKLDDLQLDAQVLLNLLEQVAVVGGRPVTSKRESAQLTNIREILNKTFHQLIPELRARRLPSEKVRIDVGSIPSLWLPKAAFSQVVFNLFMNAVKYAQRQKHKFELAIIGEVGLTDYLIHFQDWGIGVDKQYEKRIFDESFRTPEAQRHDARGLGLGLTISQKLMLDVGGNLTLVKLRDPTDFQIAIPKNLIQEPREAR